MADVPLVVWLRPDGPTEPDGTLLGGKAAALARLVAFGQPVPRAAVLTTAAYDAVATTPPVRSLVGRLHARGGVDGDRCDGGLCGEERYDDEQIDQAFLEVALPEDVRRAIDELTAGFDGSVAVRSSATAEDLTSAAFAGQYRTILTVDPAALERAIRLVWASSWHEAPRAYRRLRGVDDRSPAMAVLVMEMIEPEIAGVLFTRDPVGDESNVRLETVEGCGESLVSGDVTPDAHTWPRDEATLAATRLGPAFGELVDRGLALESGWGMPLDVEFAVDGTGRLWLMQARPVTTLATGGASTLTRAGVAEMLPGVLPPLLQATAGRHVDEGFRNLLGELGADLTAPAGAAFVRFERSRALLDLARLREATSTVPGGSVAALDRGYGVEPSTSRAPPRTSAMQIARVMRRRRAAVLEAEIVVQAVDRLVAATDDDEDRADLDDLLARWERVQDLGARATTAEMAIAALATAAHEGVQHTLTRYVGPDLAGDFALRLTTRPGELPRPLDRCLRAVDVDPTAPVPDAQWKAALARSGSRSVFGGPTWADDPELARLSLTTAHPDGNGATRHDLLRSIEHRSGSRRPRLTRVRRRFVRREAADAAELLVRRERTKQALLDLGGIANRLVLDLAARLCDRGVLASHDDVWLLTPAELRRACSDGTVPDDLDARRSALAADHAVDTATVAATGDGHGWPASPGTATGHPVVVDVPRAGAIQRGDVLVARTTDAAWAPLFALASAIVVEEGGPLSHASIVARELGVPAVVNLPGIVERLRTAPPDSMVSVDGSTGRVTIVERPAVLAPVIGPPDDEPRLGVFVTGLIGASALLGVIVSITEAVSSARGVRRTRARATVPAEVVADVVVHGTAAARRSTVGLPPAPWYGRWAILVLLAGLIVGASTLVRYAAGDTGGRILWLVTALSALPAAVVVADLARRARAAWPDVPPVLRRVTTRRPAHTTLRQWWRDVPAFHRRWIVAFGSMAVILLLLNVIAPGALRVIDEPLYDALGAPDPEPWAPDWFGMNFGRPQVVIPVALLVALFTVRCRVLALAYPLTIVLGGALNLGLGALVGKDRPPLGPHAGQTDSFPSGHAIEVTLLLGLAPLAVAVLLRSRWAGRLARLVASGILAVMLVDGLRDGSHWPTDHLGGFAIAMTVVVLVHALARMPSLHASCTRCPAMAPRVTSSRTSEVVP